MGLHIIDSIANRILSWLVKDTPPSEFPLSDYEKLRHEIRPCDVLLVEGRSRVSEVIKVITQSSWSHAMLYIGRIHDIENPKLRQRVLEFYPDHNDEPLVLESLLGKGTIISPLSHYKRDHIRICRPKGISHQDAQHVIGFAIGKLGVEYDIRHILDLARFMFPWSFVPRRWRSSLFKHNATGPLKEICSSLLAQAFGSVQFPILPLIKENNRTGVELIPRNTRLFTPSDFDYSPFFEIIKYPIFEMSLSHALYRHLPWNREGTFGNDDGSLYTPPSHRQRYSMPTDKEDNDTAKSNTESAQQINLLKAVK